ncbi:N-ethylmaleimide reductase [Paraburkholderia caffeinitolerans]|uniref:N-ethylmaleimide reductase n=1 Tax=Paraburkholderia caffeinitolerans TaxID=1723730 RepID=A0A6J5GZL7_9BURK|nr:N-ethylmaleimide reductase [Paraburkholderia caffeinitolerans]
MRVISGGSIENRARFALEVAAAITEEIGADVESGLADLESYGQMVLANPDFVERLKTHSPMNEVMRNGFFGGAAVGYSDYPTLRVAQGV